MKNVLLLVWLYGISTTVGYLMPNTLYTYILHMIWFVEFYGISTIVGYLMPNPFYTNILNRYDTKDCVPTARKRVGYAM